MYKIDEVYDYYLGCNTVIEDGDTPQLRRIYLYYSPTIYAALENLFLKYPFVYNDHIVDFGCGKGRVLIMAALYSCTQITGYELDEKRYEIAIANVKSFKEKFYCDSVFNIFNENIENITIDDTMNKFFFFNPFHLKVYIKLFKKINLSLKRKKRDVYIFLYRSHESTVKYINSLGIYKVVEKVQKRYSSSSEEKTVDEYVIYKNN